MIKVINLDSRKPVKVQVENGEIKKGGGIFEIREIQ